MRPLPLLAWRYVIAAAAHRAPRARPAAARCASALRLWAIGSVFVFNSIAYFRALEQIPASVTALVLYTYPVIVALLAALVGVERLTWRALLAALGAFAGCALTAGGAPAGAPLPALRRRLGPGRGARLRLLHRPEQPLRRRRSRAGPGAAPRAGGGGPLRGLRPRRTAGSPCPLDPRGLLAVAGIGVVSTVVAMTTFLAGMALIGPTRASVLSSLEVIVTLVLAFLFLGERLGPWQWAGAALILGAVAFQNLGALRRAMMGVSRTTQ